MFYSYTGGNVVKIWDVLGGGKLLHVLKSHQKTVTCLCLTPSMKLNQSDATLAPRLLTGSLDGHVKVFDISDFKVFSFCPCNVVQSTFLKACSAFIMI